MLQQWRSWPDVQGDPLSCQKSCLNRVNPMRIFFGGGTMEVGVFSDQPLCRPLLSCNWHSLSVLSSAYHGSFHGLHWGTSVPDPWPGPLNLKTCLLCWVTILTIPKSEGYPLS